MEGGSVEKILIGAQKIPFVGSYFVNEIPPEDNVSRHSKPKVSTYGIIDGIADCLQPF